MNIKNKLIYTFEVSAKELSCIRRALIAFPNETNITLTQRLDHLIKGELIPLKRHIEALEINMGDKEDSRWNK